MMGTKTDWMEQREYPRINSRKKKGRTVTGWRSEKIGIHKTRGGKGIVGRLIGRKNDRQK